MRIICAYYFFVSLTYNYHCIKNYQKTEDMAKQSKTDPKKGKKSPKTHTMKTKSGGKIEVSEKAVKDAKAKTGAFKERPAYKGKTTETGTTSHAGVFTRTTGPVSRRKAAKALAYDKKLHQQDSIKHSATIKSFATAKRKGTN